MSHPSLYAAFDLYPSAKGAATHIYHAATSLFDHFDGGLLYVLGNEKLPLFQQEGKVEINRFNAPIPNYLYRAQAYSLELGERIQAEKGLKLVQFRDIWSGTALLANNRSYRALFEVNGLPSIELPYRYPDLEEETLEKFQKTEQVCLERADHILCPSAVIGAHLQNERGISPEKITVIPNGAEFLEVDAAPEEAPFRYILYFGALQSWQGVDVLLKALRQLLDWEDLTLVICASNRPKYAKALRKFAEKLGIAERIIWKFQLSKTELASWVKHAALTVAPLKATSRNLDQGCCPLKILESLALATPVIASDLPVVRELMGEGTGGRLVRPERPAELAQSIRFYLDYPAEATKAGEKGQQKIMDSYSWESIVERYQSLYRKMLNS